MSESDEATNWQRAVEGDGNAFARLFDDLHPRVFGHALRLTANRHDAEDVVAAAFLELWRRRNDVRVVDGSVAPWLLVTTTNLALNQSRGMRRYRTFLSRLPRQEPTVDGAEDDALLRADLDIDPQFVEGIRSMPALDQQLLSLVAFEDYSLRAAAQALAITEHAARSRWQRIRRRLSHIDTSHPRLLAVEN